MSSFWSIQFQDIPLNFLYQQKSYPLAFSYRILSNENAIFQPKSYSEQHVPQKRFCGTFFTNIQTELFVIALSR